MQSQLGIGVVGLHEGCTLLVALSHTAPGPIGSGVYLLPGTHATADSLRAPHARAVAGCDLRQEKIDAARARCPDLFYTTSYAELLARPDVDIVAIYTPDPLHADHIIQAFAAGKHVICTKPLVTTPADARRVLAAAQHSGQRLLVGQSTRFFEPFQRQRWDYEAGAFGTVELADAHYIHRMDWFYEKSAWAIDQTDWVYLGLSHPIDLVRWYLGPISEVQAIGSHSALARRYQVQSFDIYAVNLRAADGRMGRVLGHYGLHELPTARNAIELMLYGSDGTSQAQYHDMRYRRTDRDGGERTEDPLYHLRGYYFNNETHGMHYGEFANYTEHFALAILENQPAAPDLIEGIETFCIMEAVRRSAASGQPVAVGPILEEAGAVA